MKTIMRGFIFIWLAVASGMALLAGNAMAEVAGLESYPLVCQKALVLIDNGVKSFNKEFGPSISKKSHKLSDPGFEGILAIDITYRNAVTLSYEKNNGFDYIHVITLGSSDAIKKVGYHVQSKSDIRRLYGAPYEETPNSLKYGCDATDIIFKTNNEKVIAVVIIESAI